MMKRTVAKCGGLPKVITAIGECTNSDLLEGFSDEFMRILETSQEFNTLKGLFSWMQSYFDDCSDSVKPCIFYLAVFPADYNVRKRRLLRRWIAEGYSRDTSAGITAEENGERLFSELMELSVIQQQSPIISTKLISTCQVNGFFREYIISRPMEDNLVFALEGHCSLNSHRTGQHLTIGNTWDRDEAVFKSMDLSRLRSFTVFGEWKSFLISSSSSNMRLLRVLDLEDTTNLTDDHLHKIGKLPPRLKFLSLRGCIHITYLPDSVGKLRQLQTLDVTGISIVTMAESIINLNKLQYTRAGITDDSTASTVPPVSSWLPNVCRHRCLVGVEVPGEIGKLTALHTLGVINVAASGAKVFLPELKKLTQLCKLRVSGINKHNSKQFFYAISEHGHFESLSMRLNKDNNQGCCLDGIPLPLKNLRSLKLHGLNNKLPEWGSDQLSKLVKLDLEMATLMEGDIEFLGKLPQLCILRIKQLQDPQLHFHVHVNGEENDCYENVKVLEIACSSSSSSFQVTFGCKAMKKLEKFKVDCPSVSSFQFSGLEHLSGLREFLRN
ncbi:disease resistance protein Pik-2-like [Triticum aestivum]|uniref:disease resistance protein Pik-2-like n=1 Tax=Triticum aestivum TaxID=4565 RepID=UPI001D034A24|nr:disease resistance protein Pik-2-like [Triticum aestivum]